MKTLLNDFNLSQSTMLIIIAVLAVVIVIEQIVLIAYLVKRSKKKKAMNGNAPTAVSQQTQSSKKGYQIRNGYLTEAELGFYNTIFSILPQGYILYPQVNLASVIEKGDTKYHSELFYNIDFGVFDSQYRPMALIEINDAPHTTREGAEHDKKVNAICAEAGISLIWLSDGVDVETIRQRVYEAINARIAAGA